MLNTLWIASFLWKQQQQGEEKRKRMRKRETEQATDLFSLNIVRCSFNKQGTYVKKKLPLFLHSTIQNIIYSLPYLKSIYQHFFQRAQGVETP